MTPEEFNTLAASGYTSIPLVREVLGDLDTPLSAYLKLAAGPYSYLLESAAIGSEKWGRYSIIGLPARELLRVRGNEVTIERNGTVLERHDVDDPLAFIAAYRARFRTPVLPHLPRFSGGLVGYFGYDTVRYVERRLRDSAPPDTLDTPDILLMVSNDVVIFDNVRGRMTLITHVDPADQFAFETGSARLQHMATRLREPAPAIDATRGNQPITEDDFVSVTGREPFLTAVEAIREYIRAGDVMQVVLSQRMSTPLNAPPINLYRALRSLNPSPYMYFMDLDDFHIVSSSPEILARLDGRTITNRPLAGTRRRGHDEADDLAMERELRSDPKELAEHLMLIDLARNDVGRVAEIGSVAVTERFTIERLSHVMHISSNVVGTLKDGLDAIDLLRATLPVGTLSGAPKIRAMEIIDELEPVKRGIYGGAVGYLAWNGNMDTAIAIRTGIVKDKTLYIQAGGGVVADSIGRLEWKESMNKGRAMFRAAELAERGLEPLD